MTLLDDAMRVLKSSTFNVDTRLYETDMNSMNNLARAVSNAVPPDQSIVVPEWYVEFAMHVLKEATVLAPQINSVGTVMVAHSIGIGKTRWFRKNHDSEDVEGLIRVAAYAMLLAADRKIPVTLPQPVLRPDLGPGLPARIVPNLRP